MTQTVSLRRAAKIRNKIEEKIRELQADMAHLQTLNLHILDSNVQDTIHARRNEFLNAFTRLAALNTVLYTIRVRIGSANAASGINDKLTLLSLLNTQRQNIRMVLTRAKNGVLTPEQITNRLALLKAQVESGNNYVQDLTVPVVNAEIINALQVDDRKLSSDIDATNDSIEEINNIVTVEIDDAHISVLQAEGLL